MISAYGFTLRRSSQRIVGAARRMHIRHQQNGGLLAEIKGRFKTGADHHEWALSIPARQRNAYQRHFSASANNAWQAAASIIRYFARRNNEAPSRQVNA